MPDMQRALRLFLYTTLLVLLGFSGFLAGYLYHAREYTLQSFPVLNEAYEILQNHSLKEIPKPPALEYGMVHGMLRALDDPYTIFVEPPQHELQSNQLEGSYGGIGVSLEQDEQGNWALFPYRDGPAWQAGVRDGDRLQAVDNLEVSGETPADIIRAAIRGPVGQKVRIRVLRPPDNQALEWTITRQEISLPSVTWRQDLLEPVVGVIKVNLMAATTAAEIQKAVADLTERGSRFFVLDLRDNPGGYLSAGVEIARLFLTDGVVMQQQYKGKAIETYTVEQPGSLADIPLAVLINGGSASAAEIAAGALQAQERAPLVGAPSFGKDTIQLVFDLRDKSSLHVTAARWWIPGLRLSENSRSLQPDLLVEPTSDPEDGDAILSAAIGYLLKGQP